MAEKEAKPPVVVENNILVHQKKKLISGVFTPLGNRNSLDKFAFKQVATAELIHKNYTRLQYYHRGLPITDSVPESFSLFISNDNCDPQHIYLYTS